jgi:hypothetical protein
VIARCQRRKLGHCLGLLDLSGRLLLVWIPALWLSWTCSCYCISIAEKDCTIVDWQYQSPAQRTRLFSQAGSLIEVVVASGVGFRSTYTSELSPLSEHRLTLKYRPFSNISSSRIGSVSQLPKCATADTPEITMLGGGR